MQPDDLHTTITRLAADLTPHDEIAHQHRTITLDWLAGTQDIYRRAKPATPTPHLVSYFLLVDRPARSVLLCDHLKARLWLPTGGHVEPGEHPYATVEREITEELGITATPDPVHGRRPFLLTATQTRDTPENQHTDISFWFALAASTTQQLHPDPAEFAAIRWWPVNEIRATDPVRFDPHLGRALDALNLEA
ncbi:NUDIX domain-containing protein [Kineosporia sp. J2-2]|uniref:NUDIX domain-containing protein n=1 Tax=Kineosporia corallincola TaxID=2835133 RepID=A0ABS5TBZ9_9ACTN|nr:NUDIX domain-containing protein [Kineosporia corallincola]MBT0768368.1 NUDIX domain-containing protein [Kineosporia corallincola]